MRCLLNWTELWRACEDHFSVEVDRHVENQVCRILRAVADPFGHARQPGENRGRQRFREKKRRARAQAADGRGCGEAMGARDADVRGFGTARLHEGADTGSVRGAAERLAVSVDAIYDLCDSGKLPCQRVGKGRGTIRISPAALASVGKPRIFKLRDL